MTSGPQFALSGQLIGLFVVAPLLFLLFLCLYRRREGIRHFARRAIIAEAGYFILAVYLGKRGISPIAAISLGVLAAIGLERLLVAPRSRHIPATQKRKAIAAHERRTGRKYDRKMDEFDHEIAFSRGGSSTADNLRIRARTENRRKGTKSPWWDLLGR